MNNRNMGLFVVIAAAAAVGAFMVVRGERKAESAAADAKLPALFPGLESRINDVAAVTVETPAGRTTAELKDGAWTLKDKSGYPIDAAKVREIVLNVASMKNLEPRTSRADQYKAIGVEDVKPAPQPAAPEAASAEEEPPMASQAALVTLTDKDAKPLAAVIVGNTKYESGGNGQSIYVRKPGEATSYLARMGARRFEVPRQALNWVETKFVDIARDRVWSVMVTPREGAEAETVTVRKENPAAGAFVMQYLPAGRELKNPGAAETFASALASCSFEDVAPVSTIDFDGDKGGKPGATARVRMWDGLVVDVAMTEQNGKTWWKLVAAADSEPYLETQPAPPPTPGADGTTPSPSPPAEPKPRRTTEEVAKEVHELNASWSGWAFAAPAYKSTMLNTKLSTQLKDPAPPPATPPDAPVPPGLAPAPPNP